MSVDELPDEMYQRDRQVVAEFSPTEELYRRCRPQDVSGESIELDAIELPDMSTNRSAFGPPEWLLLDVDYAEWGVFSFEVRHIPSQLLHLGVHLYDFGAEHVPLRRNYPHTEVRAYKNGSHVSAREKLLLEPELHQRWRQLLLWHCRLVLKPAA